MDIFGLEPVVQFCELVFALVDDALFQALRVCNHGGKDATRARLGPQTRLEFVNRHGLILETFAPVELPRARTPYAQSRYSRCRSGNAVSSGDEGTSQRDAADCRQARHSIRG